MERRNFVKAVGLGVLGVGGAGMIRSAVGADPLTTGASPVMVPLSDRKEWARQNFRGMENFVLPSFTPDQKGLDEEGIRNDVRQAVRQGFVSTMPMSLGLSREERRRMLEIVADEARGNILVTATVGGSTLQERIEGYRHAERIGISQAFFSLSSSAQTEEELYRSAAEAITSTDLNVVLYGQPNAAFLKFDPSGIPINVFDRLADLPNVIAVKLTQVINPVTAYQLADQLHDRILIGPVHLELVPLLANKYPIQWSGQWAVDALQSPEKRYAVDFMDAVGRGRMDEAMRAYWAMQPASQAFFELQAPLLRVGGHPWSHIKYYHWATGGNGGLFRDSGDDTAHHPTLDAAARQTIRDVFRSVGITTVDLPDEAFAVGNAAYARGVRLKDLESTPHFAL